MVSFPEATNLISLIFQIPACIIYIIFLVILFKKRKEAFSSAFYDYIRLLGIVDLSTYFLFYGAYRAGNFSVLYPLYEQFLTRNWFITIWLYASCVIQNTQHYLHMFLAINRFCVFNLPYKYQQHLKLVFKASAVFAFVFPAIYLGWILFAGALVMKFYVPKGMPILYGMENLKNWSYNPSKGKTFAIVGAVCYLISFAFNVITVAKLYLLRKKGYQNKQAADTKLFFISLLLFLANIIHCVFYVFQTFNSTSEAEIVYYFMTPFQMLAYDFACLSTPFCFMILSPSLRKNIFQVVMLKKGDVTISGASTRTWTS